MKETNFQKVNSDPSISFILSLSTKENVTDKERINPMQQDPILFYRAVSTQKSE